MANWKALAVVVGWWRLLIFVSHSPDLIRRLTKNINCSEGKIYLDTGQVRLNARGLCECWPSEFLIVERRRLQVMFAFHVI